MMVRTQISLDSERHAQARARAAELGVSLAEYIRRLVNRDVARPPRSVDRSIVFDLGGGIPTDITRDKDRMILEAVTASVGDGSDGQ
jgi:hypothetical protein